MKGKFHWVSLLALAFSLPSTTFAAETGLRGGTATVEVTPQEWPLTLRGSFFPKPAKSARDPLHVRALAFENGTGRAVIVIVDVIGISRDIIDPVKKRAAKATWTSSPPYTGPSWSLRANLAGAARVAV